MGSNTLGKERGLAPSGNLLCIFVTKGILTFNQYCHIKTLLIHRVKFSEIQWNSIVYCEIDIHHLDSILTVTTVICAHGKMSEAPLHVFVCIFVCIFLSNCLWKLNIKHYSVIFAYRTTEALKRCSDLEDQTNYRSIRFIQILTLCRK